MKYNSKIITIATLIVIIIISGFPIWAQEDGHGRETEEIVNEIQQNQGVDSISEIDPDRVRPALLEELGDSIMGLMIADEQQHAWMDEMMGG